MYGTGRHGVLYLISFNQFNFSCFITETATAPITEEHQDTSLLPATDKSQDEPSTSGVAPPDMTLLPMGRRGSVSSSDGGDYGGDLFGGDYDDDYDIPSVAPQSVQRPVLQADEEDEDVSLGVLIIDYWHRWNCRLLHSPLESDKSQFRESNLTILSSVDFSSLVSHTAFWLLPLKL